MTRISALFAALALSACAATSDLGAPISINRSTPVDILVRGADNTVVSAVREALLDALPLPGGGAASIPTCSDAMECTRLRVDVISADGPSQVATTLLGVFAGPAEVILDVRVNALPPFRVTGTSHYGNAFVDKRVFAAKAAAENIVHIWKGDR